MMYALNLCVNYPLLSYSDDFVTNAISMNLLIVCYYRLLCWLSLLKPLTQLYVTHPFLRELMQVLRYPLKSMCRLIA